MAYELTVRTRLEIFARLTTIAFQAMPPTCTFVLPALAIESIGAHRPTFRQKLAICPEDPWDVAREPDGPYVIRCTRESALVVATLLQSAGRSPVASTDKMMACVEGAATIITQLNRDASC